jgi:hypothetical protein
VTAPKCTRCARPVADSAYVCRGCAEHLARRLGDITALADDLTLTRTRQAKLGGTGPGVVRRNQDRPLPWNERASRAEHELRTELVAWVRIVIEERGGRLPKDTLADMSGYLLGAVEWLRHYPAGAAAVNGIGHAVAQVRVVIDRAPDRWYAGQCSAPTLTVDLLACDHDCHPGPACEQCQPTHDDATATGIGCPEHVYFEPGATTARCRTCGTEHDVEQRRKILRARAEDILATTTELVTAVSSIDRPVPTSTIRSWVHRKRLEKRGETLDGRPLYRVGDVLDLIAADIERETRRASA